MSYNHNHNHSYNDNNNKTVGIKSEVVVAQTEIDAVADECAYTENEFLLVSKNHYSNFILWKIF